MGIKARLFITSTGFDPNKGKDVKDPNFGDPPTLGACMPNIRRQVAPGDYIFVVSGKVPTAPQYVIGGFEVVERIHAREAYERFPAYRLQRTEAGLITGNIIVDENGEQHPLDHHRNFEGRLENYIVGRNAIMISTPMEVARARRETLPFLCDLLGKKGAAPIKVIGRSCGLDERQLEELLNWLRSLKSGHMHMLDRVA